MKAFIEANFKMIDIDSDGVIGTKEFRYNCITRVAVDNIQTVDDAFDKLLDVSTISICVSSCSFLFFFFLFSFIFYLILDSIFLSYVVCLSFCAFLLFIVVLQFVWSIFIFWLSFRMQKKNKQKMRLNAGWRSTTRWIDIGKIPRIVWSLLG